MRMLGWVGSPHHDHVLLGPPEKTFAGRHNEFRLWFDAGARPPVAVTDAGDGLVAVVDGESFNSDMDTARLLLDAVRTGNTGRLGEIDGTFAAAVWDETNGSVLLARDRYGHSTLYFRQLDQQLWWSADFNDILSTMPDPKADVEALDFFLATGLIPAPRTPVKGVEKMPAASAVEWTGRPAAATAYWRLVGQPKLDLRDGDVTERIRLLLTDAVRRRIDSDGATGLLLSGGVDSMLLAAVAGRELQMPLDTFTFTYRDYEGVFNEQGIARRAADWVGSTHHEISIGPEDIAERAPELISSYGEPMSYGVHSFRVDAIRASGIATVFTGSGPDRLYSSKGDLAAARFARMPRSMDSALTEVAAPVLRRFSPEKATKLTNLVRGARTRLPGGTNTPIADLAVRRAVYQSPELAEGHERISQSFGRLADLYRGEADQDVIAGLKHRFGAELTNHSYTRWGRLNDVVYRFPYYDARLQDFVVRLPRSNRDKQEFRNYATELLPDDLAAQPKVAQTIPLAQWFRTSLSGFLADQLDADRLRGMGLFDPDGVAAVMAEHEAGGRDHAFALWGILAITLWIDGAGVVV